MAAAAAARWVVPTLVEVNRVTPCIAARMVSVVPTLVGVNRNSNMLLTVAVDVVPTLVGVDRCQGGSGVKNHPSSF